jgi:hypothetical protein
MDGSMTRRRKEGFPYLLGLPEALHLPRRDEPAARIPPGAVAERLADEPSLADRTRKLAGEFLEERSEDTVEAFLEDEADILERTGFEANTLVMGYRVWQILRNHPDVIDRIKYSGGVGSDRPARVSISALQQLFDIERIMVMMGVENTAKEGDTTSHSFIGGKHALLCHAAPNPGIMTPSAGYTFSWNGYLGAGAEGNRIKRFRMENKTSDRVEIEMAFDQKLVAADLGHFFKTAVA